MSKINIIKSCSECSHTSYSYFCNTYICSKKDYKEIKGSKKDFKSKIPKWCPLKGVQTKEDIYNEICHWVTIFYHNTGMTKTNIDVLTNLIYKKVRK